MSDLVERVSTAIREAYNAHVEATSSFEGRGGHYTEWIYEPVYPDILARAAIAEVRRFDVERGPSDAEIEGSCEPLRELRGEPGADAVLRIAAKIRQEEPV